MAAVRHYLYIVFLLFISTPIFFLLLEVFLGPGHDMMVGGSVTWLTIASRVTEGGEGTHAEQFVMGQQQQQKHEVASRLEVSAWRW